MPKALGNFELVLAKKGNPFFFMANHPSSLIRHTILDDFIISPFFFQLCFFFSSTEAQWRYILYTTRRPLRRWDKTLLYYRRGILGYFPFYLLLISFWGDGGKEKEGQKAGLLLSSIVARTWMK